MKNGWAMTFLGSRKTGNGYVLGTQYEQFNYFLNISKRLNENNQISFTVTGAPQTHYQRSSQDGLSVKGWQNAANYMPKDSSTAITRLMALTSPARSVRRISTNTTSR